jgi:hypothetical protein
MSTNIKTAFLHGLKVAGHIIIAALVVGASTLLSGPGVADKFASALLQFGIPVALTNILFAMVLKFIDTKAAQVNASSTPTPPTV